MTTSHRPTAIDPRLFRDRRFFDTPALVDEAVADFCRDLSPDHGPSYVDVRPAGTVRECFFNVRTKVERDGGALLYGWAIWEWRPVSIEAEHHAVWVDPTTGCLVDVTPHEPPCERIVFLPDPSQVYDFQAVQRRPLVRRSFGVIPEVQAFMDAARAVTDFIEANSVGRQVVMPRQQYRALQDKQVHAQLAVIDSLARRTGPNDLCICSSGRKYKRCCRPFIQLGS